MTAASLLIVSSFNDLLTNIKLAKPGMRDASCSTFLFSNLVLAFSILSCKVNNFCAFVLATCFSVLATLIAGKIKLKLSKAACICFAFSPDADFNALVNACLEAAV